MDIPFFFFLLFPLLVFVFGLSLCDKSHKRVALFLPLYLFPFRAIFFLTLHILISCFSFYFMIFLFSLSPKDDIYKVFFLAFIIVFLILIFAF